MKRLRGLGFLTAILLTPICALAQQYSITTLASFNGTDGADPQEDLFVSGNTIYGTTSLSGTATNLTAGETVFSLPITGGTPTVLMTLPEGNSAPPGGAVTLINGTLYGTNPYYMNPEPGLFSLPTTGGTPTQLSGSPCQATLTASPDGSTLYGTYANEIFSLPIGGGAETNLGSLPPADLNESSWSGHLTVSGGYLYGAALYGPGGASGNDGFIYSLPVTGGTPTILTTFGEDYTAEPVGDLVISPDGTTLYGTTFFGGNSNFQLSYGAVFSEPVTGGTPTILGLFNRTINGSGPDSDLVLSNGMLYGVTQSGGRGGDGVVFSLPVTGGTPTALASFNGTNGSDPEAGLFLSGNTLYGTTFGGGADHYGTVFSVVLPEPASGGLIAIACALLMRRNKRTIGGASLA